MLHDRCDIGRELLQISHFRRDVAVMEKVKSVASREFTWHH